ncbi:LysM peptidoglycan-binding domain-containing protein [Moraxella sp. PS-22]|uniref:LysM peptidoglycan-binding domain-containing protein n=1 Tax=Moraxella tetraodonis TaxID=2767221 RepID=A0A9X1UQI0_9GAMM|nr:LysM peptidoglycan-binding domain-containing protein [Moraxella tetraodonis]MCG8147099.1 LysM peptidoglycan-binding domain-containing protein [Moraxella tetraodonis]
MKFSKQALLGTTVLLGGSVLLYATMHQVLNAPAKPAANSQQVIAKPTTEKQSAISNEPLTADIATEKNLLAQKQKEREQRVAAQEQQAQQYMTEQQRIEAEALARSRAENQLYANKNAANTNSVVASSVTVITQPVVKPRPVDTVAAPPQTQAAVPNSVQNTAQSQSAAQTRSATQTKEQAATPKPTVAAPVVAQPQPAAKTIPNNPGTYQVKAGDGLIGLSRRYNVPVDVLASVNNLNTTSNLRVGQTINIPTAAQVNRITQQAQAREQQRQNEMARKKQEAEQKKQQALLQQQQEVARKKQEAAQKEQQKQQEIARKKQEAQLKEQKRQQEIAQKKLEAQQQAQKKQAFQAAQDNLRQARQTVKQTDAKGTFGVQVALATDEKKANEITQKLQAAGYKVKTTQTSKGVRIVVGPEKGKVAALALKDKLNNDSRVDVNSGWVLYW